MITFNDFIKNYNLKNKATSNIKIQQVISSLGLNDLGIYLRDVFFKVILEKSFYIHQKELIGFVI